VEAQVKNAVCGRRLWIGLLCLAVEASAQAATQAVRLLVSNDQCDVTPCPATHPIPPLTATPGVPFYLAVAAVNADGSLDPAYTGIIHLSSTDPDASLPQSVTLGPQDGGGKLTSATLRTLGAQTISATDEGSPALTGSLTLTVIASSQGIPELSRVGALILAGVLALAAVLNLRRLS
jgi:hypothetical protein